MSKADTSDSITNILIVGGGTAGWLTATILASQLNQSRDSTINISLIEAPGIPIVGVGEGTWPSMRMTLRNAGIKEADFLKFCSASFKQGSKFVGWRNGEPDDFYYHPFELPVGNDGNDLSEEWWKRERKASFSKACCVQETLCELHLSPKLKTSRDYAGIMNYGYHLDAGKFSEFLRDHCTENLNVALTLDRVRSINSDEKGHISSVQTENSGRISADLFIDCTGFRSLLLGQHMRVGLIDKSDVFPINSALAVRIPYAENAPVKSPTLSTAQEAGWIWDIGLSHRRGVGYVYCDKYISREKAQKQLQAYLGIDDEVMAGLSPKHLNIRSGYRTSFWVNNCVAIGLSAGFLEPLEATAMMLIENSAHMVAASVKTQQDFDTASDSFNVQLHKQWDSIIDFLKLHYALSNRPEPFWQDVSAEKTISKRLRTNLKKWQADFSTQASFNEVDDVFPNASYQYVLHGMNFHVKRDIKPTKITCESEKVFEEIERNASRLASKLLTNREMLDLISVS